MDTDDERIDFSTLDPSRNDVRWRWTVDALVARAVAERRRRLTVEDQLLRWARPVLAVAAGLCIVAWAAGLLSGPAPPASQPATANPPALTWASWAANNQIPEPSDLVAMVRGD